jgi:Flp pilus assembly pilin Flp
VPGFTLFRAAWLRFAAKLQVYTSSEAGATAVEYSLLVAFIATAIIASVGALGDQVILQFQSVIGGF